MPAHTSSHAAMPAVHGTTDLIFTAANPVAQVKAPEALNLVFARFGVDAVVVPARVDTPHFESFVRGALGVGNVRGMLVSIPHKTRLMAMLDRPDAASRLAGAANAVRRADDGAIEGGLFDGSGFVAALRHHGVDFSGRRALLLGAGGAGLAIASALATCADGPQEIAVFDAAAERAVALVDHLDVAPERRNTIVAAGNNDPSGFHLVINATPLGLNPIDPLPLDPRRLGRGSTVIDILMKDQPTPIELACIESGVRVYPGHEMMVQQIPDYLDFFGYGDIAASLREANHPAMLAVRNAIVGDRLGA